jgi:chromosome partitioning protein
MSTAIPHALAVCNGKGGVSKTTVSTSLAALAATPAEDGTYYRTLLVDLDPQGDVSYDLGYEENTGEALKDALVTDGKLPLPILRDVRPNLDVVPGGIELEEWLGVVPSRIARDPRSAHGALQRVLLGIASAYDLIVIDCPPGYRDLQKLALVAARHVVVPTRSDKASVRGMYRIARLFENVQELNPDLQLLGVAHTQVAVAEKAVRRALRAEVDALFGDDTMLFDAELRHSNALARAVRDYGRLPHELAAIAAEQPHPMAARRAGIEIVRLPASSAGAAGDLAQLTAEILTRHVEALEVVAA